MPGYFNEIAVGRVENLGHAAVDRDAMAAFCAAYAPGWNLDEGLPEALIFAVWSKLEAQAAAGWPRNRRVATDALRFARNPAPGELLRARMTILGKDQVGETKGIILAQHDLLDESGRLVFSCLTRNVFPMSPFDG